MAKTFVPPSWCQIPRDPLLRKQTLCLVLDGGAPQPLGLTISTKAVYTIGRAESGVDLSLKGALASRLHAAICQDADGQKYLVDLKSTQGTFLNGKRLEPHVPVRWSSDARATFGSGPQAESLELTPCAEDGGGDVLDITRIIGFSAGASEASRARRRDDDAEGETAAKRQRAPMVEDPLAALYGDLPDATVTKAAPRIEERKRVEPIPVPVDPRKIIFLDIDGVLRSVHGRTDFAKNVRTMLVEGQRVALMGDSTNDNIAGIDFWPHAVRALRHVVLKTQAGIVLSSEWRKQEQLVEGINNQLTEYGMPKLFALTPDLDKGAGVVKAIHNNLREKRTKEIRKWLRQHPKVERWTAIDDMDLCASRKDELIHQQSGSQEPMPFLDIHSDFVKCNPAVGLNMDLAKLAVCFLNDVQISPNEIEAVYSQGPADAAPSIDPNFQGMGPTVIA